MKNIISSIKKELLRQAHKLGSIAVAYKRLGTDVVWPVFWTGDIWLNVLLLFYCAAAELTRAVGVDKIKKIFFSKTRDGGSYVKYARITT